MKVKKYTASSMPEAMKQVRAELGSEAVILNSRVIQTGGFMGFFKKSNIEVIAAIDPDNEPKSNPVPLEKPKTNLFAKPVVNVSEKVKTLVSPTITAVVPKADSELMKEIFQLKELLKQKGSDSDIPVTLPEPINWELQKLREQEVNPAIIDEVAASLLEKWYTGGAAASRQEINKWSAQAIINRLAAFPFGGISFNRKFVNVIGPTGVGKTTTLAKVAAECVLKHQKKVAFITTDTYRIAAIEQLKTYAKILDVPIEVCYNMGDFKSAADKFKDFDLVFIDTAGRNFRNQKYVTDLKEAIDFNNDMETFLVLALTSKQKDMEEIRRQFSLIHIDKFIFTKMDETSVYGSMLNMAEKFSTGIAYVTNGQDVPDDLIEANSEIITNTILGVSSYE
jgi:flagellar biosynthesis protein FlhF